MATIVLDKDETFEHSHDANSKTHLISGEVNLSIEGEPDFRMITGEEVLIPANAKHVFRNVGVTKASIGCN